jgi:hypothetical protein
LDCNGGTLSGGVSLFFGAAILEMQNCIQTTNPISVSEGAEIILNGGNTFTPISGQPIFVCSLGSTIYNNNETNNVAGGTGSDLISGSNGCFAGLPPLNQTGDITWTDATVRVQAASFLGFNTWTANGHTVTGTKYILVECGVVEGASNIPGSVAGSASCTQAN